jgi:hypothetical protein
MNHRELEASYASYDVKDCQAARKSLRYYKNKAHKTMRRNERREIMNEFREIMNGLDNG